MTISQIHDREDFQDAVELGPRCSRVKPTPPAGHQLILDRERTGRGEKREGDKIYYKCEDPSHSINGTQAWLPDGSIAGCL